MPNTNRDPIPLRQFGRHEVKISALGFGGHHLGDAPDESSAVRLVRQAVDGGIHLLRQLLGISSRQD